MTKSISPSFVKLIAAHYDCDFSTRPQIQFLSLFVPISIVYDDYDECFDSEGAHKIAYEVGGYCAGVGGIYSERKLI